MSDYVNVSNSYFWQGGDWAAGWRGVRPIISLKSNVTIKEIKKLENQNVIEDTWDKWRSAGLEYASGDDTNGEAGNYGD